MQGPRHIPIFEQKGNYWVDSVYNALTDEQRLGQLFMAAAYSRKNDEIDNRLVEWITRYNLGGLIFMQGSPEKQAKFTNYYQSLAKTPLLISMDAEYGLKMRLDSTLKFPNQLTMGAMRNNELIYEMGAAMAKQCKRIGVHVSFSPVVDINNNPDNPVINFRSFGEQKELVTAKANAYMAGLQDNGVLACLKHFPGHGDTDSDSHYTLPSIQVSRERLDSLELYPYKQLFSKGAGSVMVAHLHIAAIDSGRNRPTSLSYKSTTQLLKNELGFNGLVFTDALNMKGVSNYFEPGEAELQAILAGNDVLLFSEHVPLAIERIKKAIALQEIYWDDLESRIKKVLMAKYWCGLNKFQSINLEQITEDLNDNASKQLIQNIYEEAVTLVKDEFDQIPIQFLDGKKIVLLSVGKTSNNKLKESMLYYGPITFLQINSLKDLQATSIKSTIQEADELIMAFHLGNQHRSQKFGLDLSLVASLSEWATKKPIHALVFGNPYSLPYFSFAHSIMVMYEDNPATQLAAAEAFFGAIPLRGKLPVSASAGFLAGTGIEKSCYHKLKYGYPESKNISSKLLKDIAFEVKRGIDAKAFPGCQVWVSIGNQVIINESFGFQTYQQKVPVNNLTIYDLASITKISASAMGLMQLFEQEKLLLDASLQSYLPQLATTNKGSISLRQLLTHQAGLQAFIPHWKSTIADSSTRAFWYKEEAQAGYSLKVANQMFAHDSSKTLIGKQIDASPIQDVGQYRYSDLGFYYIKQIIEKQTNLPLDSYLHNTFYKPLDLTTLGYQPLNRFENSQIAPTENDTIFRKSLLTGYVHDQTAAMLGGVAGHAGLFSNANDLGKLAYLWLNGGNYAGKTWFQGATIDTFTSQQSNSRRGLLFDKPATEAGKLSPTAASASAATYGHTGFTGTAVWIDPKHELIFVFLSNRTFPHAQTNLLAQLNIRTNIQQLIYDYLLGKEPKKLENN